jgi:iron-sulfur cluster assembly protein
MVTLTDLAADKVKKNLERRGRGIGIRIGVKTTGCSGLAYVLEFVDSPKDEDLKFTSLDVNIFVDPKSLIYINGITMDWQKKGLNEGFEFINPQEKDRCGCGESFRI